jgi:hypothetical protein
MGVCGRQIERAGLASAPENRLDLELRASSHALIMVTESYMGPAAILYVAHSDVRIIRNG